MKKIKKIKIKLNGKSKMIIDNYKINKKIGLGKNILLCNPIDKKFSIDSAYLEKIIEQSIKSSEKKVISKNRNFNG